ncbi:putative translationally-controlled tumor protein [Corynascus novoguineensis]|uniref:Translationally-controlled tumor protein homolog n=1 Tax=Corynascus novoguineensis TaxID=1126955 RepID=A0AAN7HQ80_9PEZI|nr:putative translationally-controlled tumor protein [Corynascus novoguineensis]
MIIYKDIISDDELISDSFPIKEVDGIVYEVDCAMITIGAVQVDIGANASAEEQEEAVEDQEQKVNNIIHSFNLQQTGFDKKGYVNYLKGYMKAVKSKLQEAGKSADEIKAFETGAQAFAKKIIANFADYEFYTGEKMNVDGMVVLLNYREDGVTPYVTYWKHGLREEKV